MWWEYENRTQEHIDPVKKISQQNPQKYTSISKENLYEDTEQEIKGWSRKIKIVRKYMDFTTKNLQSMYAAINSK